MYGLSVEQIVRNSEQNNKKDTFYLLSVIGSLSIEQFNNNQEEYRKLLIQYLMNFINLIKRLGKILCEYLSNVTKMIKDLIEAYKEHLIKLGFNDKAIKLELERYKQEINSQIKLNKD